MGIDFDIASSRLGACKGILGAKTTAALSCDDIAPKKYNGLVIIGGTVSQAHLRDDEILPPIIKMLNQFGKVIAAVCLEPVIFARSVILKGKKVTYFESCVAFREIKAGCAVITNVLVVKEGRLITTNGPAVSKAFAEAVVRALTTVGW